MNKEQWCRAYEPAPESFRYAVQAALKTKEEKTMKKAISRTAVLAIALCLLMSTALAAGIGLLDFLHTNDTGEIQVIKPEIMSKTQGKMQIEVQEAACDGMTAHIVVAYKLEDAKMVWDVYSESVEEADKEKVVFFQENQMVQVNGEENYSYGFDFRQISDEEIVADYLIDLRKLPGKVPDELYVSLGLRTMDMQWETLEKCGVEVKIPVQKANQQVYVAEGLPLEQDNYRLLSAQVVRTDIGCYLTVEAEDVATAEEMEPYVEDYNVMINRYPLQGNFGMKALDENGNEYKVLYALTRHLNESDVETVVHCQVETILQRFDVGDTLTLFPVVNHSAFEGVLKPITLKLQAK